MTWKQKLLADQPFVLAASVAVAIIVPGILGILLGGWIPAHWTFVATVTIGAGYFVAAQTKAASSRWGFLRVDKLGDALGPVAVAMAAWIKWALVEDQTWLALILIGVMTVELVYTAVTIARSK